MAITVRPATEQDIPAILHVYFSAFEHSEISKRCYPPGSPAVSSSLAANFTASLGKPGHHVLVATDPGASPVSSDPPSDVLGFARWVHHPESWTGLENTDIPLSEFPPLPPSRFPESGDRELAARFFTQAKYAHSLLVGNREHWFLSYIATRRDAQRRGVGAALMRWGVDRADETGLEGYVTASEEGRVLYERFGFVVRREVSFLDGLIIQRAMTRSAVGKVRDETVS